MKKKNHLTQIPLQPLSKLKNKNIIFSMIYFLWFQSCAKSGNRTIGKLMMGEKIKIFGDQRKYKNSYFCYPFPKISPESEFPHKRCSRWIPHFAGVCVWQTVAECEIANLGFEAVMDKMKRAARGSLWILLILGGAEDTMHRERESLETGYKKICFYHH